MADYKDNILRSKYFTFKELIHSNVAKTKNIKNFPDTVESIERLIGLSSHLDTIRESYGKPISVNSGFRSKALNVLLSGSASNSYHLYGRAADISGQYFADLLRCVLDHCNFQFKPGVVRYEDNNYEVILYPTRSFIHFAYKK